MNILGGETILFTGDSITDCGRGRPIGRGAELGSGYVSLIDSCWAATNPEKVITVLNTGISGNRATDLERRWQSDVLDIAPNWLSIMIGINDVWRQFDNSDVEQVGVELYEKVLRKLLEQTRNSLKGLVLMTPYFIEPDTSDPMRKQMDRYSSIVERLAGEFNAIFVNTQAAFDRYLLHRSLESLCEDRVHPNQTGHMIIAREFIDTVESSCKTPSA